MAIHKTSATISVFLKLFSTHKIQKVDCVHVNSLIARFIGIYVALQHEGCNIFKIVSDVCDFTNQEKHEYQLPKRAPTSNIVSAY